MTFEYLNERKNKAIQLMNDKIDNLSDDEKSEKSLEYNMVKTIAKTYINEIKEKKKNNQQKKLEKNDFIENFIKYHPTIYIEYNFMELKKMILYIIKKYCIFKTIKERNIFTQNLFTIIETLNDNLEYINYRKIMMIEYKKNNKDFTEIKFVNQIPVHPKKKVEIQKLRKKSNEIYLTLLKKGLIPKTYKREIDKLITKIGKEIKL